MTSHPPEPSPPPPPPSEERPDGHGQRPGRPDEWRAFERPRRDQRDQPVNGHRAAPDYPPETGHEHAPDHPSRAGFGADGYPAPPGYPDMPDYPRDTYPAAGYADMPDYPPTPDYPPMPDYVPTSGYPPADYRRPPDHPPGPGHPAPPGYQATGYVPDGYPPPNGYPANGYPPEVYLGARPVEGAPVTHEEYLHPGGGPADGADALRARPAPVGTPPSSMAPAGPATAGPAPAGVPPDGPAPAGAAPADAAPPPATGVEGAQWAMLTYLTVPFFGFLVPLAVYLVFMRKSRWVRAHAAQAINVWLTGLIYALSAAIIGLMLVLDSPRVALAVVVPLVTALWLITLAFLVRAAVRASRGEAYTFPRWLCTPMVR